MNQQQSVTLSVDLALQNAKNQAATLRKILNESVKPDSAAYRELEKLLSKIELQADGFKQSMGEALKTSSGTKKFTSDIQKLFNAIGVAAERFQDLKGKDLIFSDADTQRLTEIDKDLQNVSSTVSELKKGKINGFFSDATKAEFKQVQEIAQRMKFVLSDDTTFSKFGKAIERELITVNNSISNSQQKIEQFNRVLNQIDLTDANKLDQGLSARTSWFVDNKFKADNLEEANQKLQEFYNTYQQFIDIGGTHGAAAAGDSIEDFIKQEMGNINKTIDQQLENLTERRKKVDEVIDGLRQYAHKNAGGSRQETQKILNNEENKDLFKTIGINVDEIINQYSDVRSAGNAIRKLLENYLGNAANDPETYVSLRQNMLTHIKSVFEGLDTDASIKDADGLKKSLSNWLGGKDVDVNDSIIVKALKSIKENEDVVSVLDNIKQAVQDYLDKQNQARAGEEENIRAQREYEQSLHEVQNEVTKGAQENNRAIDEQVAKGKTLVQEKDDITRKYEEEAGALVKNTNVQKDNNDARQTLINTLKQFNAEQIKSEQRTQNLNSIRTAITNWMGFNQVLNLTRRAVSEAINHIKQLDSVMNGIAIVTDMTTADLWKQVDAYSEMAQKFGVTIQGAYEVSKIYYQAGYETNDVLTLTNETLKLAKISGLDYATTTDYMMTA